MVALFPLPVMPRRVWNRSPRSIPSASAVMAFGWSPAGAKSDTTLKGGTERAYRRGVTGNRAPDLPQRLDPGPHLVDLGLQVLERTGVVDHDVGPGQPLLARCLVGHPGPGVGLAHPPLLDQPLHGGVHRGVDH